jgi:hypothetical protein
MKKLSIAIIAAFLLCFSLWMSAQGGPGISSPGGGGSGSGDMTKAQYDADANNKVDATAIDSLLATYQGADVDLGTWSTISPASSVTAFLSGVTAAYAYGMPNMQSGASSYVLTSVGVNKIPIWTNAPAGGGSGTVDSGTSAHLAYFNGTGTVVDDTTDLTTDGRYFYTTGAVPNGRIHPIGTGGISGVSLAWTGTDSGTTLPYLYGAPNFQTGVSSYVLTSIGPGKIPIWTNAPAGGAGSGTVNTSSAVGLAYYPAIGSAVTDFKSGTSGTLLMSQGSGVTPIWTSTLSSLSIGGGTAKTMAAWDASGNLVSESGATIELNGTVTTKPGRLTLDTTADQLVTGGTGSGATEVVVGGVTNFVSITISGVTDVGDRDDHLLMTLPYNITIKEVSAKLRRNDGGRSPTINIQECTPANSCADMIATDWVLSGSTTQTLYKSAQADFTDSVGTKKNEIRLDVVSGCTDSDLTVGIVYWINRE